MKNLNPPRETAPLTITQRVMGALPKTRLGRTALGIALILGGLLGFLPILGFWMLPLGFVVLSVDFPTIRRWRRKAQVKITRWWQSRG